MKFARPLLLGFSIFLFSTAYLASSAEPTVFYMTNVLLHMGLGILLAVVFAFFAFRYESATPYGPAAIRLLYAGASLGALLMVTGAHRPFRWILYLHIACSVAGTLLWVAELYGKAGESEKPAWQTASRGLLVVCGISFLLFAFDGFYRHMSSAQQDRVANPLTPPIKMEMEGGGAAGPFFPSSAQTTSGKTIPSNFFMTSQMCMRCHEDIYHQWFESAHHFSSFNNQWYRKSIEYMQDVIGTKPSKWCGGCHDHAVLFNGMMDTPIREIMNTPEAQAGLACTSCHAIVQVKSSMGQGDYVIEYPPLHDLATSESPLLQKLHDFLVYADPEPHKKIFMKPFMREDTAEFCSVCHKVHLDVPVNNYRWFRGFNEYDNWQASGVSGQGARSFYYPKKPMVCADCHMPLVKSNDPAAKKGMIRSHRFPGANTALPFVNGHENQLREVETFLKDDQVSVDIFAFNPGVPEMTPEERIRKSEELQLASTFAVGEESLSFGAHQGIVREPLEVIGPLDRIQAKVRRGDTIRVEVVVRTKKVGHFFPGGTVDAFDVWLELQAVDDRGTILYWSGRTEEEGKGPVEPGAHFYRALLLDGRGNPINKRNAWAARSVAYVRLIPPGAADTVHFRMTIPENSGNKIHLRAKLNYRKFAWWNTNWAFAGVRDPQDTDFELSPHYDDGQWVFQGDTSQVSGPMKQIPDLPITTMAEDEATIDVIEADQTPPPPEARLVAADRARWNDYGIGLLLQGDLKGAEQAFLKVTQMDPGYADGWVNVGRARIQEGDVEGAQEVLRQAMSLDPKLAKTHFFWALTLKSQGKYDEAIRHLEEAAFQYPRDRVVRNQMGRVLFLQRRYTEAISQFEKTLEVDPEDLQAHYNMMLCYQGLGKHDLADRERTLYLRFKADEDSQVITGPYRRSHPEDNKERQPIHEHASASVSEQNYGGMDSSSQSVRNK